MVAHPPHGVVDVAIQRASDMTGIDFGFLLGTAGRESGYNPNARAPTSSAAGLFQFVDQTWLATLKRHGARYGYARYAELIEQEPDGRYRARDPQARAVVMGLRLDPRAAALMAGEMTADHASYLRQNVGRDASVGELYAAHFLGAGGAVRMIAVMRTHPETEAAALFPEAARANPGIFRHDGRALSVAELYASLTGRPRSPEPAALGADAFAHYAAARRTERALSQHAIIEAALRRQPPAPGAPKPAPAGAARRIYTAAPRAGGTPVSRST